MRIARFGDTYAAGYTFSTTLMDDNWQSARPPIAQAVSGANGVFDYYGSNPYPIAPVLANKKFAITGTSHADLEDSLITLRAATIATDRSKLWWLDRDGSTKYWAWAKCTRLRAVDTYKERGQWVKLVDIDFYMPEGVWYGETENSDSDTEPAAFGSRTVTNSGNYNALVKTTVTLGTTGGSGNGVINTTVGNHGWEYDSVGTNPLIVDARTYTVTEGGVDGYSEFGLNDGSAPWAADAPTIDHVAWLWLQPGSNTLKTYTVSGTGATFKFEWWDTYVF